MSAALFCAVIAALAASARGHVPQYFETGCGEPPHHHTTSQAMYTRGSGGYEIKINSDTDPFDIDNNEVIDIDVVFARSYNQSTYRVIIGCGRCGISGPVVEPRGYNIFKFEPFTHGLYRSFFEESMVPKFETKSLKDCEAGYFTVWVEDLGGRTGDDRVLRSSSVIGLAEKFEPAELAMMPTYIYRNHGEWWNDRRYTINIIAPVATLFAILHVFVFHVWPCEKTDRKCPLSPYPLVFAAYSVLASGTENVVHSNFAYSTLKLEVGWVIAINAAASLVIAGLLGYLVIVASRMKMRSLFQILWAAVSFLAATILLFFGFGLGMYFAPFFLYAASIFFVIDFARLPRYSKL